MIPVTKPYLPSKEVYTHYLDGIWEREWLTNNGPLVRQLEDMLRKYLGLGGMHYVSNGTIALQLAIKALGLQGEIITTPFSYVATTSVIIWEGCTPVYADIDPTTFNIDPLRIEEKITSETSAILATHCFGNPCDIDAIEAIAARHQLKVIYDAAHCFGTTYRDQSVFAFGDVSTTSFHATKIFHTTEGGAVFAKEEEVLHRIWYMRNFGHNGPEVFEGVGINAKNSEFHAAMGLAVLQNITSILDVRKRQYMLYLELLSDTSLQFLRIQKDSGFNYAYMPIVFENDIQMSRVKQALEEHEISPRRYFYPSLSSLGYVNSTPTPVADDIASRILCLPLYHELSTDQIHVIISIVKAAI